MIRTGSRLRLPRLGAPHGLLDQSFRDHPQLDVFVLAHLDEPVEGHLGADAGSGSG